MDSTIKQLREFLDRSHSMYHAVEQLRGMLEEDGYVRLSESSGWSLKPGGKYYLTRGGSTLMAFRVPCATPRGFMVSASHSDRPGFKLKENGELEGKYTRLATEVYGGALLATWMDRPLSVAGRVMVQTPQGVESRLVDLDQDLLLIPNVAIHMNRNANDGQAYKPTVDTLPLVGGPEAKGKLWSMIQQAAGGSVLGHDLYLYVRQPATVWGVEGEYLSGAALDDLVCAWGCTQGFLASRESEAIPVLCVFDSEEVGSSSVQGAGSTVLQDVLSRIAGSLSLDLPCMLRQSFVLSADNAHALHPNHPEYADAQNAPVLGGGVVIKFNTNLRYTTDGASAAILRSLWKELPVQTYYNRADMMGGSTLGNISLGQVSVLSADVGIAQLAMHSCWETAAVADVIQLTQAMTAFYGHALTQEQDGVWGIL